MFGSLSCAMYGYLKAIGPVRPGVFSGITGGWYSSVSRVFGSLSCAMYGYLKAIGPVRPGVFSGITGGGYSSVSRVFGSLSCAVQHQGFNSPLNLQ